MVISEYADAPLVIPKTLTVNAVKDASELVAKLRLVHARGKHGRDDLDGTLQFMGLDLLDGTIWENLAAGVVEPAISKIKSLRFATKAAITILRINDRSTLNDTKGLAQQ